MNDDTLNQWAWDQRTLSIEDKLVQSHLNNLNDQEITEEVERALAEFPPGAINEDYVDVAFDIIFEAIERSVGRIK
jgi:hypothetical protein